MKKLLILFVCASQFAFAQDSSKSIKTSTIEVNSEFSYLMMEQNQDLRKVNVLLNERSKDKITNQGLVVGLSVIALGDYQKTNMDSKFAYMMRHPTSANQIGTEVSEAVIHSFQLSLSGFVNPWLSAYSELLYNPEQSFGAGSITTLSRNQIQLRKAFVAIGDLNSFPLYGALGKMDAPFGITGSVSPFTNSSMWHAFGGLCYGAQVGFTKWGLHAKAMAVQGGAQFRALNSPVADSTNVPSQLNNYVFDLNYTLKMGVNSTVILGGSYVRGTSYCQEFPVTHFDECKECNSAYTYYTQIKLNNRLLINASYANTLDVWPATYNPIPPLNIYPASKVSSKSFGARYIIPGSKNISHSISGEYSDFRAGAAGSPWERQSQIVMGYAAQINNASKLFLELFRTDGYTPLNFISGSDPNQPFPAGVTHSVRDAFSHGVVIGAQIVI